MLRRQTSGSVVCPSCGKLTGVQDETCWNCGRRYPGMWGYAAVFRRFGQDLGFVQIVLVGCAVLYGATLIADNANIRGLLSPSPISLLAFGASGQLPVISGGRWWTLLSASWLHGSLLHFAFNMMWIRQLAPDVAQLYGAGRMVIIYVLSGVMGFAASSFGPSLLGPLAGLLGSGGYTVGASAAIFGLLGAQVLYGRKASYEVGRQAWIWAAILFVLGFVFDGTDNWAHLGGFIGGFGVAALLDPLKAERVDHLVAAVLLLLLSAVAVAVSLITGVISLRAL
ncbi:MAG: rhomboid family intramembrane serine protease [Acidobacteriota bacterium]